MVTFEDAVCCIPPHGCMSVYLGYLEVKIYRYSELIL